MGRGRAAQPGSAPVPRPARPLPRLGAQARPPVLPPLGRARDHAPGADPGRRATLRACATACIARHTSSSQPRRSNSQEVRREPERHPAGSSVPLLAFIFAARAARPMARAAAWLPAHLGGRHALLRRRRALRGDRRRERLERAALSDVVPDRCRLRPPRGLAWAPLTCWARRALATRTPLSSSSAASSHSWRATPTTPARSGVLVLIAALVDRNRDRGRDLLPERALAADRGSDRRGGEPRRRVLRVHRSARRAAAGAGGGCRRAPAFAGPVRIISLVLNVPGGIAPDPWRALLAYIFMPKKRVLDYSLDAGSEG